MISSDGFLQVNYHLAFADSDVKELLGFGLRAPRSLAEYFDSFCFHVDGGGEEERSSSSVFDFDPFSAVFVGDSENGDVMFILCDGMVSDWTVAMVSGAVWGQWRMSFSEFLVQLFGGEGFSEIFPAGWPEPGVRLVRYDDETGGLLKGT